MGAATRVDGEVWCPSLEMPRRGDQDLLWDPITDVVVEHPASLVLCMGALAAFGPMALALVPPSVTLSVESLTEGWIILPFVELSTRYAILQFLPYYAC